MCWKTKTCQNLVSSKVYCEHTIKLRNQFFYCCTAVEIYNRIKKLDSGRTAGIDGISYEILKLYAHVLAQWLLATDKNSFYQSVFPACLEIATLHQYINLGRNQTLKMITPSLFLYPWTKEKRKLCKTAFKVSWLDQTMNTIGSLGFNLMFWQLTILLISLEKQDLQ